MIEEGGSSLCLNLYLKRMESLKHKIEKTAGPWREAWNGFKKSKVAVVGMGIVLFFILLAICLVHLFAKEGH